MSHRAALRAVVLASILPSGHSYYWITSTRKTGRTSSSYALCVTEKVGCSEFLEYSRWLSLTPTEYCRFETWHSSRQGCSGQGSEWLYGPQHAAGFAVYPIRQGFDTSALPECLRSGAACDQPTLVAVRGPWERLVSGFVDKYVDECKGSDSCFRQHYMPNIGDNASTPAFVRYLRTLATTPDAQLNEHFRPQSEQCLRTPREWDVVADLGATESLDRLSKAMGAHDADRISSVMQGAYGHSGGDWCWEDCSEYAQLIGAVHERFMPDLHALAALGLHGHNESFVAAARECRMSGTLCHDRTTFALRLASSAHLAASSERAEVVKAVDLHARAGVMQPEQPVKKHVVKPYRWDAMRNPP